MALKIDQIKDLQDNSIISKSGSNITLGASNDTIAFASGVTNNMLTPALKVTLEGASQTGLTSATYNKVEFNTNDTGVTEAGTWDASNYRWTPGVSGNYFLSLNLEFYPESSTAKQAIVVIYKNGTGLVNGYINMNDMYLRSSGSNILSCATIDTANTTDYYEAYIYVQTNSGTFAVRGFGYESATNFCGFRIK